MALMHAMKAGALLPRYLPLQLKYEQSRRTCCNKNSRCYNAQCFTAITSYPTCRGCVWKPGRSVNLSKEQINIQTTVGAKALEHRWEDSNAWDKPALQEVTKAFYGQFVCDEAGKVSPDILKKAKDVIDTEWQIFKVS